jgi:hypothetical protein
MLTCLAKQRIDSSLTTAASTLMQHQQHEKRQRLRSVRAAWLMRNMHSTRTMRASPLPFCGCASCGTLPASRRYWARSFAGWHEFAYVQPNAAHEAIARLQGMGWLDLVITQNVDRLHHKGGSGQVLELHGTTHRYAYGC